MSLSTLPIFDRPGTVLPARGQQKRRPCRNADLHRAALLFPEHQTTIFPYEKRPFLPPLRETEKGIFVCPLAGNHPSDSIKVYVLRGSASPCGVLDKISFRCSLQRRDSWSASPCRVCGNRSCVKYSTHSAKRKVIFQIPLLLQHAPL